MLSLEDALEQILADITPLSEEEVRLLECCGRWLARDVHSTSNLPPFDNSAMDGFAVRAADTVGASVEHPVKLQCVGQTPAGKASTGNIKEGECWRVFTGSPLPAGGDAVVMQEDVQPVPNSRDQFQFLESARPWDHIRFRGEDVKVGNLLARGGTRINFAVAALLGATGCQRTAVHRRLKVALLATGNELVEPDRNLGTGQTFESNRLMLASLACETGCVTQSFPIVPDDLESTRAALSKAFAECHVVISSGGVSVGDHDHVKAAFESLGGTQKIWKVAIRPGKPFVHGRLAGCHFFGLPGNPVSAATTFLLLVRPALIRLQGGRDHSLKRMRALLSAAIANPGSRRHFVRVRLDESGGVESVGMQGSHVLSGLAKATGLVDVPPDSSWESGREVEVLLFPD